MASQALDGRRFEQVCGIDQRNRDALRCLQGFQRQLELRTTPVEQQLASLKARQAAAIGGSAKRAEVVVHHLEQRVVVQRPLRIEHLDQFVERHVLMGLGGQGHFLDLTQPLPDRRLRLRAQAHHQGIDEEADHAFQLLAIAVVHRHADAQVMLAAVTLQQHGERGEEKLEQGRTLGLGEATQLPLQISGQPQVQARATVTGLGTARMVGRKLQYHRLAAQLLDPEILLALHLALLQPGALPVGVVGVLHGQGGQLRGHACSEGAVQLDEFVHQQAHRPTVGGDVVQGQHQHAVLRRARDHLGPHQRSLVQVEQAGDLLAHCPFQLRLAGPGQFGPLQVYRGGGLDLLAELVVALDKGGTQRFMTRQQGVERPLQRLAVQFALQPHRQRRVIGSAVGLQGPEQPLALLRIGRRQGIAARLTGDGCLLANRLAVFQRRGQRLQVGGVEDRAQRQVQAQLATYPRDDLHRQQRMAAKAEEVVLEAYRRNLEHLLPDACHCLLQRSDRGHVILQRTLEARCWQRTAVELAVGGQWHDVQGLVERRQHVVRQALGQPVLAPRKGLLGVAFGEHHIGHQLRLTGITHHQHRSVPHLRGGA
ncbi:hypothetical protein PS627_03861 [Pseudomonas fluorescens]|nr:hypothetical protein PS627_03861 [Pseudomonas fluorescens]